MTGHQLAHAAHFARWNICCDEDGMLRNDIWLLRPLFLTRHRGTIRIPHAAVPLSAKQPPRGTPLNAAELPRYSSQRVGAPRGYHSVP